jgi:2-methylaconitate cis-trans-isomerase PrpF
MQSRGSKTGKLLPTGNVVDRFDDLQVTCIDASNPCVFVEASDLNISGTILPEAMETHPTLLKQLHSIRQQAAVAMGLANSFNSVPGSIPKIAIVSPSTSYSNISGENISESSIDLVVRALSVGQPHRAIPITVALAVASASKIKGSVVEKCLNKQRDAVDEDGVTIGHASGRIVVGAELNKKGEVKAATVFRTARRLMEGIVYWK